MTIMPHTLADLIVSVLNTINNFLGGLVDLGASQPLTPTGSTLVNGVAHNAVTIAQILANMTIHNPIP